MEKVPEIQNSGAIFSRKPEISGPLFQNYGTSRNIVPENSGSRKRFPKNVKVILNLSRKIKPESNTIT